MNTILDIVVPIMNWLGDVAFAVLSFFSPAAALVLISAILGWLMLMIWGWTSNQAAIKHVRNQIAAHLLSTRLFKDNLAVTFRAQRMILWNAVKLMGYSLKPMIIMAIPFLLVMSQIGLRYEHRPFRPGERVRVTATLKPVAPSDRPMTEAEKEENRAALLGIGSKLALPEGVTWDRHDPCRAEPERTIDWRLSSAKPGAMGLVFGEANDVVHFPLEVGDGLKRISSVRGGGWLDRTLYSAEPSIPEDSRFDSIRVMYPARSTPILGFDVHWLVTLFVLSIVFALVIKPFTKVHI